MCIGYAKQLLHSNCSQHLTYITYGSLLADQDLCANHEGDARVVCCSEGVQEPALRRLPFRGLVDGLWHWLNLCLPLLAPPGEAVQKMCSQVILLLI